MGLLMSFVIRLCTISATSVKLKACGRRDFNASGWKLHKKLIL